MRIDKNGEETIKTISYRPQFINSARFIASLLSNLVNILAQGIHKIKCKYENSNENCETCRIEYKHFECCLRYARVKDDLIQCKCLC